MGKTMEVKPYYLGLDMGTDSVGWAVTDFSYQIIKKAGKALWGINLFDAAQTAEQRRLFRTARRRNERRSVRLDLLQELFAQEINKVDPGFYARLNDSFLQAEDKQVQQTNSLFNDKDFDDKAYHKKYPTIYHLRYALMTEDKPFDIRLVYLASHHILKHRGHFLFPNYNTSDQGSSGFDEAYDGFCHEIEEQLGIAIEAQLGNRVAEILKDRSLGVKEKGKQLDLCLNTNGDKALKAVATLLSGGTSALSDIFQDEALKDEEINKISFSATSYEEQEPALQSMLGDRFSLIEETLKLFDWSRLAELMGNAKFISQAKIHVYEKHKKDLRVLKNLLISENYKKFISVFRSVDKDSYSSYIGMCKKNGQKLVIPKRSSQEDFYKNITSILKNLPESENKEYVLKEIGAGNFLPLAVSKINGVIPYQLHEQELKIILKKAEKYLPFLKAKDQYGTVSEKILSLLTFRIPFYIGPLNSHSDNSWVVKKDKAGHIYPWNFTEMVDEEKSAEAFIRRMTNKCTYLVGEDVLPKNSLLYTEFVTLNELNNVRIGTAVQPLSAELKDKVFHELFLKHKKVTAKNFSKFLKQQGIEANEADQIQGIDGDFNSSLAPWIDMQRILGVGFNRKLAEEIIKSITLFSMEPKMLKKQLGRFNLQPEQIRSLCKLKYSGWGRLSEKLLSGLMPESGKNVELLVDTSTGEVMNLITALKKTHFNFMELMSDTYGFSFAVSKENQGKIETKLSYDTVKELAVSPAVKRPIWQTLKIVKEIAHIMGGAPSRIFVEMARAPEKNKKKTISRKQMLLSLYKSCKEDTRELSKGLSEKSDSDLRSDKLYLYYTQMGKSMYTGKPIALEELWNENVYDIDHIYPRSKTADDSLDNRVLVEKNLNSKKSDTYPLPENIRHKMSSFWKMLLDRKLISQKKYNRLTRNTALSADELAEFINRQLVETRQSTKAAAGILKNVFPDTTIIYAKAGTTSRFRKYGDFVKVRELNDYHHAKDAYLNIVVGNAYYTKFTSNPLHFLSKENKPYSLNENAFYGQRIERNGNVAWIPGKDGTMATVRKWMGKNNILFTRMTYQGHGALFDQMPVKKGNGQVPLKNSEQLIVSIEKYGGYNKASTGHFLYVEGIDKKGNSIYVIETLPLYMISLLKSKKDRENYIKELWSKEGNKFLNPKIYVENIPIQTLVSINGFKAHITGRTGNQYILRSAEELIVNDDNAKVIKSILKFIKRTDENKNLKLTGYDWPRTECGELQDNERIGRDLENLYTVFQEKLKNSIYAQRLSAQNKALENGKEIFKTLTNEDRCRVLYQILHFFQCNPVLTDLSLISGKKKVGTLRISKMLNPQDRIQIIFQSPTGFFEKRVSLAPYGEK